jgi:hypothetical protein
LPGIAALALGATDSAVTIVNSGPIATAAAFATGIDAQSQGAASPVSLVNSGPVATLGDRADGLIALTSDVSVVNSGPIATAGLLSAGIDVSGGPNSHGYRRQLEPCRHHVFAKLDVTFGEDLEGFGGKAGMRVSW